MMRASGRWACQLWRWCKRRDVDPGIILPWCWCQRCQRCDYGWQWCQHWDYHCVKESCQMCNSKAFCEKMCWDCAWTLLMPLAWHFTLQGQCARCWNSFACCSTMLKKHRVKYLCQDCSWTAKMYWDCGWTLLMPLAWHFTLQGQCAWCWNSFAWCLTNVLCDVQLCWKSIESNICVKIALLHLGFHLGIRNRRHCCAVGFLSPSVLLDI